MKGSEMLKAGQVIMYRRSVCEVVEVLKNFREDKDYYKLAPVYDKTLIIQAPVEGFEDVSRPLLTKTEAEALIDRIPSIDHVETEDRMLETVYKDLYGTEDHDDLVRIIKTTYLRGEKKAEKGQKRSEKDKEYFRKAENVLYSELAVALGKSVNETKGYVVERVAAMAA